jgi:tetratricopeptide (TPR) repeat protein
VAEGLRLLDHAGRLGPPTRAFHLRRADLLARQGHRVGAAAERRRAKAVRPARAGDYYLNGVEEYQRGEIARALRSFHGALQLQPDHFEAQCFLAVCSLNAGRPGEARVGLTAGLGQRPGFAWLYLLRGVAAVQEKAFTDADADFTAALRLDAGAPVRYAVHANRGRLRLLQGKLDQAIAELEKAATLRPDEVHAHLLLAQAFRRQKRFADAGREISTAVRLRPDLALVHRARGQLHLERGDRKAALRDFRRAIRLEPPGSSSALVAGDHVECGRILQLQGRFREAGAAYDSALAVCPDHALAHYLRGEVLLKLNRPRQAERAFGRCLRHRPGFGPAFRGRGAARVRRGDFAGGVEDYTRAVHLERDAGILAHRGWAYFFTDAWKLAERDFAAALRLDGGAAEARVGRGLARVMRGDYRGAVADADEALRRHPPDTPEMMHNLACLFALAAARVRADAAAAGRAAAEASYRGRAVAALRRALALVPPGQRLIFWRQKMRADPALDPIRHSAEFVRLEKEVRRARNAGKEKTVSPPLPRTK